MLHHRMALVATFAVVVFTSGCRLTGSSAQQAIPRILEEQDAAWNRGDIEKFMEPYWHSDELTFVSAGKVTTGWQATLDGYRERYPTAADMGRLTFSNLEVRELGRRAALVLGRWDLTR
jgi:ketosteroid isomerase-like protein